MSTATPQARDTAFRDLMNVAYAVALGSIEGIPLHPRLRRRFTEAQARYDRVSASAQGDA